MITNQGLLKVHTLKKGLLYVGYRKTAMLNLFLTQRGNADYFPEAPGIILSPDFE